MTMLDYTDFSALRLQDIFASEFLAGCPAYAEVTPDGAFECEYKGGLWQDELIDGVRFWFPEGDRNKLAIVELWASPLVAPSVRDRADLAAGTFISAWKANGDRVLEALKVPVHFGEAEAAVESLAAGAVRRSAVSGGTIFVLSFAIRAPDFYEAEAVVHSSDGLLKIGISRPDLVWANQLDDDDDDDG